MSERTDGVIEARPYHRNYYRDVRGPKTAALKAVAAAACEICGYGWAAMYGGYKAAIFVCYRCCAKLIEWDHERERTLCQVCHAQPAISLHESTQLRCCFACKCSLPEVDADPWDTDKKLGHIFSNVDYQHESEVANTALCGAKAPISPIRLDMTMPPALQEWGMCVPLSAGLPRSAVPAGEGPKLLRLCDPGRQGPGDRPGRGNQLRRSARDSQTNFT